MSKGSELTFLQDIQVVYKQMKRGQTSVVIRESQIKATMRYYLTPSRMTGIRKSNNNKC